jgi:hypothetical protein
MLIIGSVDLFQVALGILALLCIYWLAKFIISMWTGA